jgi:hypothetical protein
MQLLTLSGTTAVAIGVSPFFQGQDVLMISDGALQLQGSNDGSTGWTNIGSATVAGVYQAISLTFPYLRVSTAGVIQLINN